MIVRHRLRSCARRNALASLLEPIHYVAQQFDSVSLSISIARDAQANDRRSPPPGSSEVAGPNPPRSAPRSPLRAGGDSAGAERATEAANKRPSAHADEDATVQRSATLKTASVDTDSASVSANTPSPEPSRASPPPPSEEAAAGQPPSSSSTQLQIALKLLVSNSASGLIIGRAGSTVSDLQAKSRTRIKLSQGGDYYPGTSDRVCLIQGPPSCALAAVELVLEKLYELQSSQQVLVQTPASSDQPTDRPPIERTTPSFIVRLLVPSTCCGMIIGRGGSNIKSLKEKSEVTYLQLSPKEHEVMIGGSTLSTSERIMTITGPNFRSCVDCVKIVLNDMAQNPEISRYINMTTSYSKNLAAAPSAYAVAPSPGFFLGHDSFPQHHAMREPTPMLDTPSRYGMGELFAQHGGPFGSSPRGVGGGPPAPGSDPSAGLLPQQLAPHPGGSPADYGAVVRGDASLPAGVGDPYESSAQPSADPTPVSSSQIVFAQYQPPPLGPSGPFWSPDASSGSPGRATLPDPTGALSAVDRLAQRFQAQASLPRHPSHPSSPPQRAPPSAGAVAVRLGVPDSRVGSILGRGGKTLAELQGLSRTRIRISQRGDFVPGTRDRVVTISGSTARDVEHARRLLSQRLAASFSRSSSSSELRQLKDG
ncbi:hypothetical protein ACHAWF_009482 [Thalassiosira exigua]